MKVIYLYDEKAMFPAKSALALRDGLGLKTLTSLDSTCYYLENLAHAKRITQHIVAQLETSSLKEACQHQGLPPMAMGKVIYHDVLIQVIHYLDLQRRFGHYLAEQPTHALVYRGQKHWKWDLLAAMCQQRGMTITHKQGLVSRVRVMLVGMKRCWQAWRQRGQTKDSMLGSADFLFFLPITRLARGLLPVMAQLAQDYKVQAVGETVSRLEGGMVAASLQRLKPKEGRLNQLTIEKQLPTVQWEDGEASVLDGVLKNLVIKTLADAMPWVSSVQQALLACPKAVVVASFVGEPLLEVARAMRRRTVVIQTCGTVEYNVHLAGESLYLLASEQDRQCISQQNASLEAVICGHVGYDANPKLSDEGLAALRQRFAVQQSEKLIVFVGTYATAGLIEWESIALRTRMFLQATKSMVNVRMVLKLHPYEHRMAEYATMLDELDMQHVIMTQSADVNALLQAADAVVMLESTVGQESIVLGKPLLDMPVLGDWYGYHRCGATLCAYDAEEVRTGLEQMLYDADVRAQLSEGRARYLAQYFPMQDGGVTARICAQLKASMP